MTAKRQRVITALLCVPACFFLAGCEGAAVADIAEDSILSRSEEVILPKPEPVWETPPLPRALRPSLIRGGAYAPHSSSEGSEELKDELAEILDRMHHAHEASELVHDLIDRDAERRERALLAATDPYQALLKAEADRRKSGEAAVKLHRRATLTTHP
ncbi:MAG TPA: hypothetical protein VKT78_03330 [Fimbriimonadaceae bacterium]|nr:hypothetical protein [Fimbriimonadaceae bacterium]